MPASPLRPEDVALFVPFAARVTHHRLVRFSIWDHSLDEQGGPSAPLRCATCCGFARALAISLVARVGQQWDRDQYLAAIPGLGTTHSHVSRHLIVDAKRRALELDGLPQRPGQFALDARGAVQTVLRRAAEAGELLSDVGVAAHMLKLIAQRLAHPSYQPNIDMVSFDLVAAHLSNDFGVEVDGVIATEWFNQIVALEPENIRYHKALDQHIFSRSQQLVMVGDGGPLHAQGEHGPKLEQVALPAPASVDLVELVAVRIDFTSKDSAHAQAQREATRVIEEAQRGATDLHVDLTKEALQHVVDESAVLAVVAEAQRRVAMVLANVVLSDVGTIARMFLEALHELGHSTESVLGPCNVEQVEQWTAAHVHDITLLARRHRR